MGASAMTGLLIPIGFQCGHGTVAGLRQVLLPIDQGAVDLGYGMATIGIITAAVWGTLVSNFHKKAAKNEETADSSPDDPSKEKGEQPQERPSITIPTALIGLAVAVGWLLLFVGDALAQYAGAEGSNPVSSIVPLFPLAMLAGLVLQVLIARWGNPKRVDRRQASGLSDIALSMLVVTALGSLDLQVLAENGQVLLTLGLTGVATSLVMFATIGRLALFRASWFSRSATFLPWSESSLNTAFGELAVARFSEGSRHPSIIDSQL